MTVHRCHCCKLARTTYAIFHFRTDHVSDDHRILVLCQTCHKAGWEIGHDGIPRKTTVAGGLVRGSVGTPKGGLA